MFDFIISSAIAQDAAKQASPNPLMSIAPFIVIFVIFYFLMIRPQKRKMQEERSMIGALSKGDEIFTKSGIIGKITGLTEKIVTLEVSDGVRFKMIRTEIGGLASKLFEKTTKTTEEKK